MPLRILYRYHQHDPRGAGAEPGQAAGGRRLAQQYAVQRKERLALAYAEAATQTPPALDDALRSAMAAHFDARALTELTALIGLQNLSARFNAAMAIPAQGLCQIPTSSSQNKGVTMRRLRDYSLCLCLLLLWPLAVNADDSWRQIQTEAHGRDRLV